MSKLHLYGWLYRDSDKMLCVGQNRKSNILRDKNIIEEIEKIAKIKVDTTEGLGGRRTYIPDARMRAYATDDVCNLDEAIGSLVDKLYGEMFTNVRNTGYSEWTITGLHVEDFRIGGHDLNAELDRYIGQYIHFILEYED